MPLWRKQNIALLGHSFPAMPSPRVFLKLMKRPAAAERTMERIKLGVKSAQI